MKTKLFVDKGDSIEGLDVKINRWIRENDVEVIDIKFSSNVSAFGGSGYGSKEVFHFSALVMYK